MQQQIPPRFPFEQRTRAELRFYRDMNYTKNALGYMQILTSVRLRGAWIDCSRIRPNKLYAQLCCLAYLQDNIHPDNDFKIQVKNLLNDYPAINMRHMGFPDNWESQPLWR